MKRKKSTHPNRLANGLAGVVLAGILSSVVSGRLCLDLTFGHGKAAAKR